MQVIYGRLEKKTIFITGVAGFIGSNLSRALFDSVEGIGIIGIDNMNDYYDVKLKESRLEGLEKNPNFSFIKGNIADKETINSIFDTYQPQILQSGKVIF